MHLRNSPDMFIAYSGQRVASIDCLTANVAVTELERVREVQVTNLSAEHWIIEVQHAHVA
jgi:hypothetical protein